MDVDLERLTACEGGGAARRLPFEGFASMLSSHVIVRFWSGFDSHDPTPWEDGSSVNLGMLSGEVLKPDAMSATEHV